MGTFSEQELAIVRRGVIGVLAAIGDADHSGLAGALREVNEGHEALTSMPQELRDLFEEKPSQLGWGDPPEDLASAIEAAREVVRTRLPEQAAAFDAALLYTAVRTAGAAQGTSPQEHAVIDQVRAALDLT